MEVFLAASATVTKAVDFVRNAVDPGGKLPKVTWNFAAFLFGEIAAYLGGINMLPAQDAGMWITGLALGAASSGFHEVFDFFSSSAKGSTQPVLSDTEHAIK